MKKINISRSLPPSLDALLPHYLIVFADVLGRPAKFYKENPFWNILERATITFIDAWRPDHDFTYIVAMIRDNSFDAMFFIATTIPVIAVTTIDVISSSSPSTSSGVKHYFDHYLRAHTIIKNNVSVPVYTICKVGCEKQFDTTFSLEMAIPANWRRSDIPAFGFTTSFLRNDFPHVDPVTQFVKTYSNAVWVGKHKDIFMHKQFTNVLLMLSISSTMLPQ